MIKTYLVKYETRDGESEYSNAALVDAESLNEAVKETKKTLRDWNQYGNDYRIARFRSAEEIDSKAVEVSRRYGLAYYL
mgnify:CR=1 FL=1